MDSAHQIISEVHDMVYRQRGHLRGDPVHDLPQIALHVLHDHEQVLELEVIELFAVRVLANYHVV